MDKLLDRTGLEEGEDFAIEWYAVPFFDEPDSGHHVVCVLRIRTEAGERVIRRDKIAGISRLPTGGLHREIVEQPARNGLPSPGKVVETAVMTTVILIGGQAVVVGTARTGTSDALHARIEKAWLGDGFDAMGGGPG